MNTKTKKVVPAKKSLIDSLRMVVLGWLLSVLLFPVLFELVPKFFGEESFFFDGEDYTMENILKLLLLTGIMVLIISFAISLAINKDRSEKFNLISNLRSTFIIAAVFNVTLIVLLHVSELFGF